MKKIYMKKFFQKYELDLLSEDGVIVAEHGKYQDMPEEINGFVKIKERKYGHIFLSLYTWA